MAYEFDEVFTKQTADGYVAKRSLGLTADKRICDDDDAESVTLIAGFAGAEVSRQELKALGVDVPSEDASGDDEESPSARRARSITSHAPREFSASDDDSDDDAEDDESESDDEDQEEHVSGRIVRQSQRRTRR